MPISSLLITLPEAPRARAALLERITTDQRITLGPQAHGRLAVVVDTPSAEEDRALFEELHAMEGTVLELVFCDFSEGD